VSYEPTISHADREFHRNPAEQQFLGRGRASIARMQSATAASGQWTITVMQKNTSPAGVPSARKERAPSAIPPARPPSSLRNPDDEVAGEPAARAAIESALRCSSALVDCWLCSHRSDGGGLVRPAAR
jgi:hypothetical protein